MLRLDPLPLPSAKQMFPSSVVSCQRQAITIGDDLLPITYCIFTYKHKCYDSIHSPCPLQSNWLLPLSVVSCQRQSITSAFPHFYITYYLPFLPSDLFPRNKTFFQAFHLFFCTTDGHFQCQSISWSSPLSTNPPNPQFTSSTFPPVQFEGFQGLSIYRRKNQQKNQCYNVM